MQSRRDTNSGIAMSHGNNRRNECIERQCNGSKWLATGDVITFAVEDEPTHFHERHLQGLTLPILSDHLSKRYCCWETRGRAGSLRLLEEDTLSILGACIHGS
jgi:hypothetical protein